MAFVNAIQKNFLRTFAEGLAVRLETPVTADLAGVRPLPRNAFLASHEEGGCLIELDAAPVPGQSLLMLYPSLVSYLLRVLLGAPPSSTIGPRAVTDIERYILREIFELAERELTAAWKPAGMAFCWKPLSGPEATAGQDTMLVFDCRLHLEEGEAGFGIAVPAFLARIAALATTPAKKEDTPAPLRNMILASMRRGTVSVEAVLSSLTLRMKDVLEMETGQVLMLSQPAGSPVECRIGGKPKFQGEWVDRGARRALVLL